MTSNAVVMVPDIGEVEGIPVIEILVAVGDTVEEGQSLVTLESDKATMDIPAPFGGVVSAILIALNDMVSAGSPLAEVTAHADSSNDDGANTDSTDANETDDNGAREPGETTARRAAQHETLTSTSATSIATSRTSEAIAGITQAPDAAPPGASQRPAAEPTDDGSNLKSRSHASPAVRRFARTLGVDLSQVKGSAAKGRVQRADVEQHVKQRMTHSVATPVSGGTGIPPIPAVDFSKFGPTTTQPLSRIQRISGPFLHRSWLNVPHVTYEDEADITEMEAFRKSLKDDPGANGVRVTPVAFFIKALCASLAEFPVFNSSLTPDGQSLVYKQYVHIGVAVDTPGGLVVPVIRDADGKGLIELASTLGNLSAKARDGKLNVDDMQGGCMTISSLGGIGGTGFTPLVNAPEVAILGIARAKMAPIWDGSGFVPRLMLPLCLSFDHRVINGAEAARFMSSLCAQLGDIRKLLL